MSEIATPVAATPSAPPPSAPAPSKAPTPVQNLGTSTPQPSKGNTQGNTAPSGKPDPSVPNSKLHEPDAPAKETPAQAEVRKEIERRKYKLKIDGQEREEELSDDEVAVRLQKGAAADKRMQESAELRKQVNQLIEHLKANPFEALKHFDVDVLALAQEKLAQQYQESTLPPHEIEKLKLQRELDAERAKWKTLEDEKLEAETKATNEREYQQLYRTFDSALQKLSVPVNQTTLRLMAQTMKDAEANDLELTPEQLAAEVDAQVGGWTSSYLKDLKGETLVKRLGPEVVREVLRTEVARVKAKGASSPTPVPTNQQVVPPEPASARKDRDPASLRRFMRGLDDK